MLVVKLHYTEKRLLQDTFEKTMEEQTLDEAKKMLLMARKLEIQTVSMHNIVADKSKQLPF